MFRKILTILTLALVVFVVWQARSDIFQAVDYLSRTNLFFIILLIPEQLFMYYCAGQIFFSYMAAKERAKKADKSNDSIADKSYEQDKKSNTSRSVSRNPKKFSSWMLARISFELNFVNHANPPLGIA